jgi:hypothetical protein
MVQTGPAQNLDNPVYFPEYFHNKRNLSKER